MGADDSRFVKWGKTFILSLYLPLVGAFLWTYSAQLAHDEEARNRAHRYRADAEQHIVRLCIRRSTPADIARCAREAEHASREAQHDERELRAQQQSAQWAGWVAALSLVGAFTGALGLYFLVLTFRANSRSADAAHDANRPWIEIEPQDFEFAFDGEDVVFGADVVTKVHGASPATNVRWEATFVPVSRDVTKREAVPLLDRKLEAIERIAKRSGTTLFPNSSRTEFVFDLVDAAGIKAVRADGIRRVRYFFAIGVTYSFGGRHGRTVRTYAVRLKDIIDYDATDVDHHVKGDRLVVSERAEGYAT